MERILWLTCVLLVCLPFGRSYPAGAPEMACKTMFPSGHYGLVAQTSKAPYTITVIPATYRPGDEIRVQIYTSNPAGFKGFFLQARNASCSSASSEVPIGVFAKDFSDTQAKLMTCPRGNTGNSVTHTTPVVKQMTKAFIWTNPKGGAVFFQATVVQDFNTVWTGVKSEIIKDWTKPTENYPDCPVKTKEDMYPKKSSANQVTSFNAAFLLFAAAFVWM